MVQIRPGDLLAVRYGAKYFLFAVLTNQIYFGGHWCFVFYDSTDDVAPEPKVPKGDGFNAFVDFIVQKRQKTVTRLLRSQEFSDLKGPENLKQQPSKGELNFRLWRWKSKDRREVEYVRFTPTPSDVELLAPEYSCLPAEFACELAARRWDLKSSMWTQNP